METDAQDVPPECKEELHCAGGHALEQIARRGCGVSITGDIPELSGHNSLPYALGWPCLSREAAQGDPL